MDHFTFHDGSLHAEDVPLQQVADRAGTPTYVYSAASLDLHLERFLSAFADLQAKVCFSVKCCSNTHLLRRMVDRGAGLDVVSGGELHRAKVAGANPSAVVFAGVGKRDEEIREALAWSRDAGADPDLGVLFNIESEPEYLTIAAIAREMGVSARAALRVRPEVQAGAHAYISTGTAQNKFGVGIDQARAMLVRFGRDPHLRLSGIHVHIGSSILDTSPYVEALTRTLRLIDDVTRQGVSIQTLDLGGGFGADYHTGEAPAAADYARALRPLLIDRVRSAGGLRVIIEPGRSIAANAGVLLTRVIFVKSEGHKTFVITDAGMNTLIRPSLYGAFHFIWPVRVRADQVPPRREERPGLPGLAPCDVVGPICESGDWLAKDRPLPPVTRGDLLAVFSAGAYGASMASRYNSHPLPAEVLVDRGTLTVIRARESYDDLLERELRPG